MKIKSYITNWKIKNSKISLIPDLGFYRGMNTIYLLWVGVYISISFGKTK